MFLYLQLENTDISHSLELIYKKKRKVYHNKKLGKIQRKTAEEEKKNKRTITQKIKINKIATVSPSLSVITLSVNGLKLPDQKA